MEDAAGSSDGLVRTRTIIVTPPKEVSAEVRADFMMNTAEIYLSLKMRLDAKTLTAEEPCMIFGLVENSVHSLKRGDGTGIQSIDN